MPSGDDTSATMGAEPAEIKWLTNYFTSLYRKELTEKPKSLSRNANVDLHLNAVEKYIKMVNVSDDLGKINILLDSLEQNIKDELMFEEDYEVNSTSFNYHIKKLKELLPPKQNYTTELIRMYEIKQNSLSFFDFALKIKSEILARADCIPKSDQQKVALKVFIEGLNDRNLINALNLQNPKSINEALKILKHLNVKESSKESANINLINREKSPNTEIEELKKQVAHLTQIVMTLRSKISFLSNSNEKFISRNKYCKYCNMSGHSDVECYRKSKQNSYNKQQITPNQKYVQRNFYRKDNQHIVCYNCNEKGHIARVCQKQKQLNQINWNDNSSQISSHQNQSNVITETNSEIDENFPAINALHIKKTTTGHKQTKKTIRTNNKTYSKEVEKDYKYIMGEYKKNSLGKTYKDVLQNAMTIEPNTAKRNSNRPILKGRINEKNSNLFLDTGSQINVIDSKYLENNLANYEQTDSELKFVTCANGTKMEIYGSVVLDVQIGPQIKSINFLVANYVFPNIIIGIHGMKSLGLTIELGASAVIVKGIRVPFLSHIDSDSVVNQKNGQFLLNRTGVQESQA